MTDITEQAQSHELLIANGNETANLLRHLANNEIDSDYFAVVSECESYGRETEAELSITDFALRAARYVDELVEALEKAQQRIDELESRTVTAENLQESAYRSGLTAGWNLGLANNNDGFNKCLAAHAAGIKVEADILDADVSNRNQPGMVVAVHIDVGDFVKFRGQMYEVKETDFDDHDVTLWFVCGEVLKCAAGCPIEVVSTPVEDE